MAAGRYLSCTPRHAFSEAKLLEEYCSPWWIAASHVRRRDRQGRIFVCRKRNAYPVKGMVKCADCGKWAPGEPLDALCCDCRTEAEYEGFLQRVRRWPAEDRPYLLRTHWHKPMGMGDWLSEGMPPSVSVIDFDVAPPEDARDHILSTVEKKSRDGSPIQEADLYDGSPEHDQVWGSVPSFHESLRQVHHRFMEEYVNKKGEKKLRLRRRLLYQKAMLPETDNALRKEIAYFQKKRKIHPRARRINNPFDKLEVPMKMPGLPFEPEEDFFD